MIAYHHDNLTGKAVVITSHSMSECEVLCSRIGIMVGGRLRCLGSAQHLRDKYGNGYVIQLKLNPQGYNLHKVSKLVLKGSRRPAPEYEPHDIFSHIFGPQ